MVLNHIPGEPIHDNLGIIVFAFVIQQSVYSASTSTVNHLFQGFYI